MSSTPAIPAAVPKAHLSAVLQRLDRAAAREVALRLTGVTRDVVGASRQLLDALETQPEAVGQLVGPGSPQDLLA